MLVLVLLTETKALLLLRGLWCPDNKQGAVVPGRKRQAVEVGHPSVVRLQLVPSLCPGAEAAGGEGCSHELVFPGRLELVPGVYEGRARVNGDAELCPRRGGVAGRTAGMG